MTYYLMPNFNFTENYDIFNLEHNENKIILSETLYNHLKSIKKEINKYDHLWDYYKKFTNPYEFIHSSIHNLNYSVSSIKPISRSFYKMIEIWNILLISDYTNDPIKTFHLAEGPGGFIEAICYLRKNKKDLYYGMTLIDNKDILIPGWKKSDKFFKENLNINLEYGKDKKGNLLNVENLWHCYDNYGGSIDLITADGGFDFSSDFNNQEILASKLIFAEICYAFAMQKKNGTFILKIYDIFTQVTIDLIYILNFFYKKVFIMKPNTSRYANSEKYLICKKFKLENSYLLINKLSSFFNKINSVETISRFININIPFFFINRLEDLNAIIGQQQIENIIYTFNLIDTEKIDINHESKIEILKKNNILKCIQWCIKCKIPFNKIENINLLDKKNSIL